jgi:DNA-binding MarR family transcriptional regulator
MNDCMHDLETCKAHAVGKSRSLAAWFGMARLLQRTEKMISARLQTDNLNAGQLDVLLKARNSEGLTQQELAGELCHTKANVSQLLDKMERTGLVRRVADGRAYRIFVSELGQEVLEKVCPENERIIEEQFNALPPHERDELFRLIEKLEAASP